MTTTFPELLDPLLLPHQLAERWSVSDGHLRNLRHQGLGVPYIKLGGRVAYRVVDVAEFEAARLVTPRDPVSFTDTKTRGKNSS